MFFSLLNDSSILLNKSSLNIEGSSGGYFVDHPDFLKLALN